jgi:hypothetical protein
MGFNFRNAAGGAIGGGAAGASLGPWGAAGGAALGGLLGGFSGDPNKASQKGAEQARARYEGLGREQRDFQMQGLDRSLGAYSGLADQYKQPGVYENFVGSGGAESGLGAYYDRIQGQNSKALNAQYAAHGGLGSGARLASQGNMMSGLAAERGRDLSSIMAQSQQFGAGRLAGQAGIAGQQAGLIQDAYGRGGQEYGAAMDSAIGAGMQGSLYGAQRQMEPAQMMSGIYGVGMGAAKYYGGTHDTNAAPAAAQPARAPMNISGQAYDRSGGHMGYPTNSSPSTSRNYMSPFRRT